MPELPEVQTVVSTLKKILPGLVINDVWTDFKPLIKFPESFPVFKKTLNNLKILDVERRGKNILIYLSGGKTLLVHQKMTGHLLYGKWKMVGGRPLAMEAGPIRDDPQNRFVHLLFSLSNGRQLALSDVRKFAKVLICETSELDILKDIKDLGPNPLEGAFTFAKFKERFSGCKGFIKDLLMKQEIISGIGNIYSSEILWEAGVHPFKKNSDLEENELKKIFEACRKILPRAVKLRGDSMVDFRDPFGRKGRYQEFHKAYDREGEKCPKKDGGVIQRIKRGGRSAFFCSKHQLF